MRATVLLILAISVTLSTSPSFAKRCTQVFTSESKSLDPLMVSAFNLHQAIASLPVFGKSQRARNKEWEHMKSDLESVDQNILKFREKNPQLVETLDKWTQYNNYWLEKISEFRDLPKEQQDALKASLEVPLSIATKHLIGFLEAPNHRRWKLGRLDHIFNANLDQVGVDLETALFLSDRSSRRYFSRWEVVRCRY